MNKKHPQQNKTIKTSKENINKKGSKMNKTQNMPNVNELERTIQKQKTIITNAYTHYKKNEAKGAEFIYKMGKALAIVRDTFKALKKLERIEDTTEAFKSYCKEQCGFSNTYGYFLINDAKVQDDLKAWKLTEVKQGDHQLRILGRMEEEELKKIWEEVTGGNVQMYVPIAELKAVLPETTPEMLKDKVLNNSGDQTFENVVTLIRHIHTGAESVTAEEKETVKTLMMGCMEKYLNGRDKARSATEKPKVKGKTRYSTSKKK